MTDLRNANPLSSGDALLLYFDRQGQPVNIAAVCTFDGVIPLDLCTAYIESKLPLIPRYLQRVVAAPFDLGLPTWEYDPYFDIRNHVREVTLRRGTEAEFKEVAGEVIGSNFDRRHPLWDFTFIRGLKGNRTGMIIRLHHCLADGISGVGVMKTILDPFPSVPQIPDRKEIFQPPPPQSKSLLEGIISTCMTAVERSFNVQSRLLEMAQYAVGGAPSSSSASNGSLMNGVSVPNLTDLISEFATPTYRLPFNVVCKGPQKYACSAISLDEMKAVKDVCGATINDVVLTLVSDVIRRHAELHGRKLKGRFVRVLVPMNLRSESEAGALGNNITFLPVNVPLDIDHPFELLAAVREAVAAARKGHMAEVIGIIGTIVEAVPTPLQAMLLPIVSELPLSIANTIVTNVPGPQLPLYLLGHKMLTCCPYVPIGGEMGMNTAVISYNGMVYFGFGGDARAIPDLPVLEKFLAASFAELRKGAGVRTPRRKPARPAAAAKAVQTRAAKSAAKPKRKAPGSPAEARPAAAKPASETAAAHSAATPEAVVQHHAVAQQKAAAHAAAVSPAA
jgi:diacylglycerol O-acyltransferase / wax synthase